MATTFIFTDGVPSSAGFPSEDYATNLETTRLNISKLIVELTENPKPSYSVNGQTIQWSAYMNMLTESLKRIKALIVEGEIDTEPFEITSQGII